MRIRHDRDQREVPERARVQNLKKERAPQASAEKKSSHAGEPGRFERKSMCFESMYFEV